MIKNSQNRLSLFITVMCSGLIVFWNLLDDTVSLVRGNEEYTHIVIIPLVSAFFMFTKREWYKYSGSVHPVWGLILLLLSSAFAIVSFLNPHQELTVHLSLRTICLIGITWSAFIFFYGPHWFITMLFPLIFLLFAVPIPLQFLDSVVLFLQQGSATMVSWLFSVVGQEFFRDGLSFHLANNSIQIAPQCSGIRSTMALLITGTIAVQIILRRWYYKMTAVLLLIPLSLLKNAIRIVTITLLAEHVDRSWLTNSFLHHSGGIFFYIAVLALYFPILYFLAKLEKKFWGATPEAL